MSNTKHTKMTDFLESAMVEGEVLSAADYLAFFEKHSALIESAEIVPAKLGDSSFGRLRVKYVRPMYKVSID